MNEQGPITLDELVEIERRHDDHCPFDCCGDWSGDDSGYGPHSPDCLLTRILTQLRQGLR